MIKLFISQIYNEHTEWPSPEKAGIRCFSADSLFIRSHKCTLLARLAGMFYLFIYLFCLFIHLCLFIFYFSPVWHNLFACRKPFLVSCIKITHTWLDRLHIFGGKKRYLTRFCAGNYYGSWNTLED